MKARLNARSVVALSSVIAIAITGAVAVPAHAARSTVIIEESNTFTSLNSGTPDNNITINSDISYMSNMGLFHYDNNTKIVQNTVLGSIKVTKNTPTDFEVTYKINPGRVWSDGAPITAADLLLTHVLTSSAYSVKAGLGDPANPDVTPAFNSGFYTGVYDQHVVGIPTLSDDGLSMTVKYNAQIPDYVLNGPNTPFPVHALELAAAGKKSLPSVAEANAATAQFVKDVTSYNTASLKKLGALYTTGYDMTTVDASTNPLLLVCNGAYQVASVDVNQAKLVLNPKYNSGPVTSGITTIVMKQGIADGAPSAQALANKDVDAYQGQPTADTIAQIKAIKGVTLVTPSSFAYEHIELRVAAQDGKTYTGPFAMSGGAKAAALRKAFLLAYPRADIVTKLIKPINPDAEVLGSTWTLPGSPGYADVASNNGSANYNAGTQAQRTAAALKLVQQYYPTAGKSTPVKVNLLWGSPGNARRTSEAALIIAEEAKAGFAVTAPATKGWGGKLTDSAYDAHFFIFDQTAIPQDAQACGTFKTGAGANYTGYSNKKVDDACSQLQAKSLPASTVHRLQVVAERQLNADAFFLGIFQNPNVTAWDSAIQGIKPAPLSPTLVWNFWEWHF